VSRRISSNSKSEILVALVVALLGASLSMQGWRSRSSSQDMLPTVDDAHAFLTSGQVPYRGVLTSYASYNPPGGDWLMVPGLVFFQDPRLFENVGSVGLYIGTVLGIFLLARRSFGLLCAIVACNLYAFSSIGLTAGNSLWQRYPIHFFYVWMVYCLVIWIQKSNAVFLAAATLLWSVGMYMFMEIAPAIFIVPVIWLIYRPPVRAVPLVIAAVLTLAVWFPYLKFEMARDFVDIESQVGRRSILPATFAESWCDPTLVQARETVSTQPDRSVQAGSRSSVLTASLTRRIDAATRAIEFIISTLLFSNFITMVPGAPFLLLALTGAAVVVWSLGPPQKKTNAGLDVIARSQKRFRRVGSAMVAAGLLFNEIIAARYLSADGTLTTSTMWTIRMLQVLFIAAGVAIRMRSYQISCAADLLRRRLPESHGLKVLAVSLLVPWMLMLLMTEGGRVQRLWWLWPLQVIAIASAATWLPLRLGARRSVAWVCGVLVVVAVASNPTLVEHVRSWASSGWHGEDGPETKVTDYLASSILSQGRRDARIGYDLGDFGTFPAMFNSVDSRYKIGARFDGLLKYRHDIANRNTCAEGLSREDEFRVVFMKHRTPGVSWASDPIVIAADKKFIKVAQFGDYQVLRAF
jgi:hypothetical protein